MLKDSSVQKTVVVLGIARSGTSLTAGLLSILGVNMGKNLTEKSEFRFQKSESFIRIFVCHFNEKHKNACPIDMTQELESQATAFVGTFNDTRDISRGKTHKISCLDYAQHRRGSGKRIVGDLGVS